MSELTLNGSVLRIARGEYEPCADLKHLFLVGNLQRPNPHPFVRDPRLEVLVCYYSPGDDGLFHWHRAVTEYEVVIEGEVGHRDAAGGEIRWFGPGDLCAVPPGLCVQRILRQPARTVAIKVPSSSEKVHCAQCDRECPSRVAPCQEASCESRS